MPAKNRRCLPPKQEMTPTTSSAVAPDNVNSALPTCSNSINGSDCSSNASATSQIFDGMTIHPPDFYDDDDDVDMTSVTAATAAVEAAVAAAGVCEESGFSDPFGDSCPNNFDIIQFINDNNDFCNTPVDSPADPGHFFNALQHQSLPQQQLLLQSANNSNGLSVHTPTIIDGLMYGHNNGMVVAAGKKAHCGGAGGNNTNGNGRLPESPPITDISGGLSSASPSSGGSASGGSPFSPTSCSVDPYSRNFRNGNDNNLLVMNGGGSSMSNNKNNNNNMTNANDMLHQQMQLQQCILMQQQHQSQQHHQNNQQQQMSPQSEFLSPYPPSQSTPGSQHSSSSGSNGVQQASPPALTMDTSKGGRLLNRRDSANNNYLLQQQQQQDFGMYDDCGGTTIGDVDGTTGEMLLEQLTQHHLLQEQQQIQQTGNGGYKRRRTSLTNGNGGMLPSVVKTELVNNNNTKNNNNVSGACGGGFFQKPQNSGGGCVNGSGLIMQRPPPPPSSNHSFDDFDDSISSVGSGGQRRSIKFTPFLPEKWAKLYDSNRQPIGPLYVHVVADKGFNYSPQDNCFVNQKKNHFQVTAHIAKAESAPSHPPFFVQMPDAEGSVQPINNYMLAFSGVRDEMPTSEVAINQSDTNRVPLPFSGQVFQIESNGTTKQTVPRLHFSATTLNNHRKNKKPNPEQKFLRLVVKIIAFTPIGQILIQAYQSDRVIVRASNPGQFEQSDADVSWQRSANGSLLHYKGQVAIGTDRPLEDAKLSVMGNVVTTGQITHPSDRRVKEDIADVDTREAMSRISQMRVVEYSYKPEIAQQWGLTDENRHRVGVIAQELAEVLPDAVHANGDFLTVDDQRIFYDTVAAAQELYRLTGNLECKIEQVEKISQKLARFAQKRRQLGSMASGISDFSTIFNTAANAGGGGLSDADRHISCSRVSLTSAPAGYGMLSVDGDVGDAVDESSSATQRSAAGKRKIKRESLAPQPRCRSFSGASSVPYCHRDFGGENKVWWSKFTQGTIVTLVVIMALCLMAMCTLYVMDWYHRTYAYPPHHPFHPSPHHPYDVGLAEHGGGVSNIFGGSGGSGNGDVGNIIQQLDKRLWTPPVVITAPLLVPSCVDDYGVPLAYKRHQQCQVFCCAAAPLPPSNDNNGDGTELTAERNRAVHPSSSISAETSLSAGNGDFSRMMRIDVLNLDVALDARYCGGTAADCDGRHGVYNLYVPVSAYLPTIPLQLRFSSFDQDGEENELLFIDNCAGPEDFHKGCEHGDATTNSGGMSSHFVHVPFSKRVAENVFELSVGNFMQSAFRFRIGPTTESCQMAESQRGRAFDEYNLIFYRVCASPAIVNNNNNVTA